VTSHIDENRLEELSKPGGPHLTEDELEHIADCGECGDRVFDRVFPPHHQFRTKPRLEATESE
jgi:hypothetical protein